MNKSEVATFGQGCFWCAEAIYQRVPGVTKVESGYSNGKTENPSYEDVCSGNTGHAEVIQVTFDPAKVSYEHLLDVFFKTHDPTTLNRQGNDRGTQYRSAIFFHSDAQKKAAEAAKEKWNKSGTYKDPIVTEIAQAEKFYKAEGYHQNYFNTHPNQPYCQYVIAPKVEKFEKAKDK
ncbi:MAG: peptide-methionine (S)-S-oxide reductase MsrA [Planctomycetota bacterium]|nr:peptide-methionine (S)-S-oxide reductase MsrA [Planctomycetota bacterium]